MDPAVQIGLVRENLALAVALWAAAQKGVITAGFVPNHSEFITSDGQAVKVYTPLEVHDTRGLVRCVSNQVRGAFAFSAIQTNRVLESVYGNSPIQAAESDLQAARCALYLINKSVTSDLLSPSWVCPPEYRRRFGVKAISFALDASHLDGQKVYWDHFGGLHRYLDLLEYCSLEVAACPALAQDAGQPAAVMVASLAGPATAPPAPQVPPAGVPSPAPVERPQDLRPQDAAPPSNNGASAGVGAPADSVTGFLETVCVVSPREMIIARDLYNGYLAWCQDRGHKPLPQRNFGMRLTSLGLQRQRRGRGRHWWLGIRLK